ncbi:MAG: PAS domain S-box protein, partial [Salinibacter sp.]|uniref:PAS domain S-box protein n=1 Tax=Salinibacter sp. TaxID=2065818 RepID=UPI0035D4F435
MGQHFSSENLSLSDKTSVLLVEEAPGDAHRFEKFLRKSSWEAILRRVQGLDEGLTALREDPPDVVIVDLNLPDEDGTTAIEHCAAAAPQVPIVALTSSDAMPSARSIEEAGAAEYLRKDRLTPALIGKTLRWVQKQRQMQDTIRRQDAWFRSMTDNVSEGVFRAGPTARIEYANEAFAALFGYDRGEEMQGIDFTTLYANPEQRGRMMAGEGAERAELSFRRPDGTTFTGLLNATAARDPNGKIQHFDGVLVDIDERKERERKLRVLSGAVQKAQEAVLVTEAAPLDEPGPQIVYANEAFEEMTGYAEEEILGETARVLQGPETDRAVLDSLRAALEAGDPWEGETVNYRKDGTPFYVQWNVAPVRNENGDIEHWVSIQRDVTEERNREERLRRQKSLLEQAQRLAGAWEVDLEAEEMSWSDKIYEIHELDPSAELTAEESFQFCAPEARQKVQEAFERCAEEGEPYDLELPIVTAEGNRRWVRTVGAPAETEEGEVTKVAGAFQDITERKEAERKLRRSRERYRSLFRDS